jgi:hypothetical protein
MKDHEVARTRICSTYNYRPSNKEIEFAPFANKDGRVNMKHRALVHGVLTKVQAGFGGYIRLNSSRCVT